MVSIPSFSVSESTIDNFPPIKIQRRYRIEKRSIDCSDMDVRCSSHRTLIIGIICTVFALTFILSILIWRRLSRSKLTHQQSEHQRLFQEKMQKSYEAAQYNASAPAYPPYYVSTGIDGSERREYAGDMPPPYEASMPKRPEDAMTKS